MGVGGGGGVVKEDVTKAAGALQLCSGQDAGSEAAFHAMHHIFEDNESEAVLLVFCFFLYSEK